MTTLAHSSTPGSTIDVDARRVPPLGGLNPTLVGLELRRVLRNRRTLVFAAVFPIAMLFVFGSDNGGQDPDVAAFVMASMALYGGATISAATGASVATERALGWSRQLRLTPLHPAVYVGVKAVVALVAGALSIVAVNVAGRARGVDLPLATTLETAGLTLGCVLTFAALGVFVGYLVPGENAMQVIGPGLALLSFLGGVFIPVSQYSELVRHIAYWTPMYGVAEVARAPITHDLPWWAVVNWAAWLGLFVVGAAWRMSKDTSRV